MGIRKGRYSESGGFTLVEILVAIGILSAVVLTVGLVSIRGTVSIAEQNTSRHLDATSASFVATEFGKDVQAATGLSKDHGANKWVPCGAAERFGDVVVSLELSRDSASAPGPVVTYWSKKSGSNYDLTRTLCRGGAADPAPAELQMTSELSAPPSIACRPAASCGASSTSTAPPRSLTLAVTRSNSFAYSLQSTPRLNLPSPPTTSSDPNVGRSSLITSGGSSQLVIKGGARIEIQGNAFINSTSPNAVTVSGGGSLLVNGRFGIQQGGGCSGCTSSNATPYPWEVFPDPFVDPLLYLPAPDESTMTPRTQAADCVKSGSVTTCRPGVYDDQLIFQGAESVVLAPGNYVLHQGIFANTNLNGSVTGSGVFLYVGCGRNAPRTCAAKERVQWAQFSTGSQASLVLQPATTGPYAYILLFHSRSNVNDALIGASSRSSVLRGVMYVPSGNFNMSSGGSELVLGAVAAKSINLTGNGNTANLVSIEGWTSGI